MSRSASSTAYTVSTARTMMLRNGLSQAGPSPAARAASRASGDSQREFSEYRASGPVRYRPPPARCACSAVECGTCSSITCSSQPAAGNARPERVCTVPRSIG